MILSIIKTRQTANCDMPLPYTTYEAPSTRHGTVEFVVSPKIRYFVDLPPEISPVEM